MPGDAPRPEGNNEVEHQDAAVGVGADEPHDAGVASDEPGEAEPQCTIDTRPHEHASEVSGPCRVAPQSQLLHCSTWTTGGASEDERAAVVTEPPNMQM